MTSGFGASGLRPPVLQSAHGCSADPGGPSGSHPGPVGRSDHRDGRGSAVRVVHRPPVRGHPGQQQRRRTGRPAWDRGGGLRGPGPRRAAAHRRPLPLAGAIRRSRAGQRAARSSRRAHRRTAGQRPHRRPALSAPLGDRLRLLGGAGVLPELCGDQDRHPPPRRLRGRRAPPAAGRRGVRRPGASGRGADRGRHLGSDRRADCGRRRDRVHPGAAAGRRLRPRGAPEGGQLRQLDAPLPRAPRAGRRRRAEAPGPRHLRGGGRRVSGHPRGRRQAGQAGPGPRARR